MEELVKKFHKNQVRNKHQVPYVEHPIGVRSILRSVLALTNECPDPATLKIIEDAALLRNMLRIATNLLYDKVSLTETTK